MRPLDRPKTVSPDVSAFLSPPDPDELVEEEIIDEIPHVPYVPPKPPPPARFANRRKLYDETDPGVHSESGEDLAPNEEVSFGEGIDEDDSADSATEAAPVSKTESPDSRTENRDTRRAPSQSNPDEKARRRRRGGRTRGGRPSDAGREARGSRSGSDSVQPSSGSGPDASASSPSKTDTEASESSGSTPTTEGNENPRRRSRRRGRRRGSPPEGGNT